MDPIADKFPHVSTYNYAENEPIANIDLHGLQKWNMTAYDPNLKNATKKQIQTFRRESTKEAVGVVGGTVLEVAGVGLFNKVRKFLKVVRGANKVDDVAKVVDDVATKAKPKYSKKAAREAGKKKRAKQPGSEKRAKDYSRDLKKREGPDAARKAHDAKEHPKKDRTVKELKRDYKIK